MYLLMRGIIAASWRREDFPEDGEWSEPVLVGNKTLIDNEPAGVTGLNSKSSPYDPAWARGADQATNACLCFD